jgi:hypothetical protein
MGEYEDFDDCVSKNSDKENPAAYCGAVRNRIEGKELSEAEKALLNPTVEQRIDGLTRLGKSMAGKIGSLFTLPKPEASPEPVKPAPLSSFSLTKDAKGNLRWFSVVSGNFKDRDREIFPADVHQEYMDFLDRTKEYPELRIWHTPGTRLGVADWADTQSGFVMMSGPIDKDKEAIAQTLASMPDQGMSHGFKFHYREPGVIGFYRTFEVSVLPLTHAAFPWTKLEITKETSMKPEKRQYLEQVLGKDRVEAIIGQADTLQKSLVAAGIEWKDFDPNPAAPVPKVEELVISLKGTEEFKAIAAIPEKLDKMTKDFTDVTAIFDASIKALQVENAALKEQIKVKSDDLLASLLRPRAQGVAASKSAATLLDPEKDKNLSQAQPKLGVTSQLAKSVLGILK